MTTATPDAKTALRALADNWVLGRIDDDTFIIETLALLAERRKAHEGRA